MIGAEFAAVPAHQQGLPAALRSGSIQLAEDGPESKRLRATVSQTLTDEAPQRGGIYAALRRSPMVGAGIKVKREATPGRKVDL